MTVFTFFRKFLPLLVARLANFDQTLQPQHTDVNGLENDSKASARPARLHAPAGPLHHLEEVGKTLG